MAKRSLAYGTTSYISYVKIRDSSGTDESGLTGLTYASSGLTAYYVRDGAAAASITLATQTTTGAYSSGGFVEVDATNMPGVYRFDIPNACLASGSEGCIITMQGATNMAQLDMEFELYEQVTLGSDSKMLVSTDTHTGGVTIAGITGTKNTLDQLNDVTTTEVQTSAAAALTAYDPPTKAELDVGFAALNDITVADVLTTAMTESYSADGSAPTLTQALMLVLQYLTDSSISGTTHTIKKLDGSTTAATLTLDSATAPTSKTRTT